jgi:hypothetical protein
MKFGAFAVGDAQATDFEVGRSNALTEIKGKFDLFDVDGDVEGERGR